MKRLVGTIAVLLALLAPGVAAAQSGGALVIAAGQHEPGSVATITQDIVVTGVVDGDVTSWAGSITVAGTVGGDVVSYGGAVTIAAGGQVRGHVLASGGTLRLDAGAAVAGQRIQSEAGGEALASLVGLFAPGGDAGGAVARALLGLTGGTLLAAFCTLLFLFWPRRMAGAAATLVAAPGQSLVLGLLTSLVLGLALPGLAALLIASVLGLPVLLLLLMLLVACYVYGLAVLAGLAGRRFAPQSQPQSPLGGPALAVVAGLALLLALVTALAPLWGLGLFVVLASPGLGAAVLSRGGMAAPLGVR